MADSEDRGRFFEYQTPRPRRSFRMAVNVRMLGRGAPVFYDAIRAGARTSNDRPCPAPWMGASHDTKDETSKMLDVTTIGDEAFGAIQQTLNDFEGITPLGDERPDAGESWSVCFQADDTNAGKRSRDVISGAIQKWYSDYCSGELTLTRRDDRTLIIKGSGLDDEPVSLLKVLRRALDTLDEQLVTLWLKGRAAQTRRAYRADARRLRDTMHKPLRRISPQDIQAFEEALVSENLSPASRARILSSTRSLLAIRGEDDG